jgi:hypothetical protein
MIEPQRPILLPSATGASTPVTARPRPVEPAPPAHGLIAWQGGPRPLFEASGGRVEHTPEGGGRWIDPESLSGDDAAGRSRLRAARLAFLAQQIYQESMPAGLHREPWAEGIGAYRMAGAEPPMESAVPAVVSVSV